MIGFLGVNKPSGISSAQLLNKIKHVLRQSGENVSIGHMGTLDVLASGVLVVAFGKATRLFNLFSQKHKTYDTVFKFGEETTTLDTEGEVVEKSDKLPTQAEIQAALPQFIGKQMQLPPKYSAKKIDGSPAYKLARDNKDFSLKAKEIEIYAFDLIEQEDECCFSFEVVCSSGTYIRSLARDLAHALGTVGIAEEIIRVKCGVFMGANSLFENQLTAENIKANLVAPQDALPWIKTLNVTDENFKNLLDGKKIEAYECDGNYFAKSASGDIMVVEVEKNKAKISINLKD